MSDDDLGVLDTYPDADEVNPEEYMRGFGDGLNKGRRETARVITEAARDPKALRIEALRAAATVVAGVSQSGGTLGTKDSPNLPLSDITVAFAEQFAAWLEKGERK